MLPVGSVLGSSSDTSMGDVSPISSSTGESVTNSNITNNTVIKNQYVNRSLASYNEKRYKSMLFHNYPLNTLFRPQNVDLTQYLTSVTPKKISLVNSLFGGFIDPRVMKFLAFGGAH